MARVTVEDCLEQVANRFALVLIASQRTRQIIKGAPTLMDVRGDNKEAVMALREVAAGLIPYEIQEAPTQEELEEAVKEYSLRPAEPEKVDIPSQLFAGLLSGLGTPSSSESSDSRILDDDEDSEDEESEDEDD